MALVVDINSVDPNLSDNPHVRLEQSLYQVRLDLAARRMLEAGQATWPVRGGIVKFPTWVYTGSEDQIRTWPVYPQLEPGLFYREGILTIPWTVQTQTERGRGNIIAYITNDKEGGRSKGSPQVAQFTTLTGVPLDEPPSWASQIPEKILVPVCSRARAATMLRDQVKQGERARQTILINGKRLVMKGAQRHTGRVQATRGVFDLDDVIQQGWIIMARAIDMFASNERPHCSWVYYCTQEIYRTTQRELAHINGESINIAYIRSWLYNHPDATNIDAVRAAGLSSRYSDTLVAEAMQMRTFPVSLDAMLSEDHNNGNGGVGDHSRYLADHDDAMLAITNADPETCRRLGYWVGRAGIKAEEAEPWLYLIGVLDFPHSKKETQDKYGVHQTRKIPKVETLFFSQFAAEQQDWGNPQDRDAIRRTAQSVLAGDLQWPS